MLFCQISNIKINKKILFFDFIFVHAFILLYKDLPAEERTQKRLEKEPEIREAFWNWMDTVHPAGRSKLEKAVNYARNHKETRMNYLLYMPDYKDDPAGIKQLMPWSDFIRKKCLGSIDTETIRPENREDLPV